MNFVHEVAVAGSRPAVAIALGFGGGWTACKSLCAGNYKQSCISIGAVLSGLSILKKRDLLGAQLFAQECKTFDASSLWILAIMSIGAGGSTIASTALIPINLGQRVPVSCRVMTAGMLLCSGFLNALLMTCCDDRYERKRLKNEKVACEEDIEKIRQVINLQHFQGVIKKHGSNILWYSLLYRALGHDRDVKVAGEDKLVLGLPSEIIEYIISYLKIKKTIHFDVRNNWFLRFPCDEPIVVSLEGIEAKLRSITKNITKLNKKNVQLGMRWDYWNDITNLSLMINNPVIITHNAGCELFLEQFGALFHSENDSKVANFITDFRATWEAAHKKWLQAYAQESDSVKQLDSLLYNFFSDKNSQTISNCESVVSLLDDKIIAYHSNSKMLNENAALKNWKHNTIFGQRFLQWFINKLQ